MGNAILRGLEDLVGRSGGPMSFRLIVQPLVAIFLAIRAGMKDARDGQPPFLWAAFLNKGGRQELIRQVWRDVGSVFIVSLVLDSIYQVVVHSSIYALELLFTATILAIVPYLLVRGLVTRLAQRLSAASRTDGRPGVRVSSDEDTRQKGEGNQNGS